jgi:AraC-like DNA-binding protein
MTNQILNQVNKILPKEGLTNTYLNSVKLFKTTRCTPKGPLIYDLCLILVLQGRKIGYLGTETFKYDYKNYLVVPTTMPFECETFASKDEPFICILVSIDKNIMYELIDSISKEEIQDSNKSNLGVFSDNVTLEIEDIVFRLLKILESKEESKILGNQILRELYYRISVGENSHFLHKMFLNTNIEAKISKSLKTIHDNFSQHLEIPQLAKEEDMSVSSFHTHFKRITSHTPLQYIKKIRLNKAKEFITNENFQVNETAYKVGYESISQFSKDFKIYYGYPPKEAKPSFEEYFMN